MLNLFINSTTYGQAIGVTFNLAVEGDFGAKLVTPTEHTEVLAPVYEKALDPQLLSTLATSGQYERINTLTAAVGIENVRVNSLAVLIRELKLISELDNSRAVTVYLADPLYKEIMSSQYKIRLNDPEAVNSFYSDFEIELWRTAMPLLQSLYHRLIFKNIKKCRPSQAPNAKEPTDLEKQRHIVAETVYSKISEVYRQTKEYRSAVTNNVATAPKKVAAF